MKSFFDSSLFPIYLDTGEDIIIRKSFPWDNLANLLASTGNIRERKLEVSVEFEVNETADTDDYSAYMADYGDGAVLCNQRKSYSKDQDTEEKDPASWSRLEQGKYNQYDRCDKAERNHRLSPSGSNR